MKSGSWSSFVAAQEVGFFGYPDDEDDYQSDVTPEPTISAQCGVMSETFMRLGIPHEPCDLEVSHGWMHQHIAI